MRGKHYRMTLLVALGVSPGIALAAPGLQNMADSLDELMKFLPMVMAPMFLLAAIMYIFSGNSGQSVEREASAETTPSPLPSSVGQLQETANGPDLDAITMTDRLEPFPVEQPGRVGRKLHLD